MAAVRPEIGERYVALDAMRGVAALMVVILHSSRMLQGQWAPGGYLAVDLFFALSGFVIAHSYDARLAAGLTSARFIRLRLLRFWPLYALGLVFGITHQLLLIATHNQHAMHPVSLTVAAMFALVFVPDPIAQENRNLFALNVPSWSLFFEILANAGYALAFPRLGLRALGTLAAIGGVAFTALCIFHGSADMGATLPTFAGGSARTLFSFVTGVIIYRTKWRPLALPLPIILILVAALLACPIPPDWRAWYDILFVLFVSPLLVAIGAASRPNARILGASALLGTISYPVYAVHRPLIELCTPIVEKLHLPPLLAATLFVTGLVLLGVILDRFFDRPARKMLSALVGTRPERPLPEASLP